MASHGAIAAAVIGAVATVTAAVLAVVLPNVLDDKGPGGPGMIIQDPEAKSSCSPTSCRRR